MAEWMLRQLVQKNIELNRVEFTNMELFTDSGLNVLAATPTADPNCLLEWLFEA